MSPFVETQDIYRICMKVVLWVVLTKMILGNRVEPAGSVFAILNPNDFLIIGPCSIYNPLIPDVDAV